MGEVLRSPEHTEFFGMLLRAVAMYQTVLDSKRIISQEDDDEKQ